ncbi:hypothetical protein ACLKA7_011316 [Drosophila subpalustris]
MELNFHTHVLAQDKHICVRTGPAQLSSVQSDPCPPCGLHSPPLSGWAWDNTQTGQVCLQFGCQADSDGGGAIRRNESTNQHTQQIRQQDVVASSPSLPTLPAAHCVSFPFPADNVDCSKVCLSISKMVFVKWAPFHFLPRPLLPVSLLGFWICIAQQQQSQQQQQQQHQQQQCSKQCSRLTCTNSSHSHSWSFSGFSRSRRQIPSRVYTRRRLALVCQVRAVGMVTEETEGWERSSLLPVTNNNNNDNIDGMHFDGLKYL